MLGPAAGRHLHGLAQLRDPRPVTPGRRRRSMGAQSALRLARHAPDEIDVRLVALVDRVTGRMRRAGRVGRTVTLRLRFADFTRATRSHTLAEATAHTATILAAARDLLDRNMGTVRHRGLTLVGIAVSNLSDDRAVQLALPFRRTTGGALDAALDDVRARFGTAAVGRAVHLGRDTGLEMPVLPDRDPD
jgi:DNA polymerase-4